MTTPEGRPFPARLRRSKPQLAVRAETDEVQMIVIRFPVDQHQIWPHMAVAMIRPVARQGMIEITLWQSLVIGQKPNDGFQP